MKIKRDFKVKVTALKTEKLCRQCKYGWTNNKCILRDCNLCEMKDKTFRVCSCAIMKDKQPCPYFERANKQEA